ncbi:MAG: hypothetical protein SGARI_005626, partial [Bacillariaceae sp.]
NRNDICNELPTGKLRIKDPSKDKMLYVDDAGREWRRNPDIVSSYHQPMSMPGAVFHSIVDMIICCVDFPVPNMKFISINEDGTWSEVICNRYTGELIVDPKYFGTSNYCTDAPNGMKTGALTTAEHVALDVKPHEKYGAKYKHIGKGLPVGYYDGDIPHPIILHEPLGGPKAIYMSKENDPNYKKEEKKEGNSGGNDSKNNELPGPNLTVPSTEEC